MSHYRVKTTWEEVEAPYGNVVKRTLYAHLNLSSDITTFYNEDGTFLFSFQDTEQNNLLDAMKRLGEGIFKSARVSDELIDGVEHMTLEEQKKCGL